MKRIVLALFLFVPTAFAQFTHTQDILENAMVTTADVNADGLDDVVADQVYRLNLGGGMFGPPQRVLFDLTQHIIATLDFDGDGAADLIVELNPYYTWFDPSQPRGKVEYHLFHNLGSGAYVDLGALPDGYPLAGDFSGDGKDDLILLTPLGALPITGSNVGFYRSNWNGTFTVTDRKTIVGEGGQGSAPQNGTGNRLAVGDLDGNGFPDVVMRKENDLVIFFGRGGGTFDQVERFLPKVFGGEALDIVDADGDGKLDLVFTLGQTTLNVMFGDGAGHFPRAATFDIGENGAGRLGGSYAVGRFTGPQPEIAIATDGGGLLLLSAQGETIKQKSRIPTGLFRQRIYSGTFEKTGKRDLLILGFTQPPAEIGGGYTAPRGDVVESIYLAPSHAAPEVVAAQRTRPRVAGPRVTAQTYAVTISDDCTSYSEQWSLVREGFFLVDVAPKPGRVVEAATVSGAIYFRVTPDGKVPGVPQVENGVAVDIGDGTFVANGAGLNPCGKQSSYRIKVVKQ